MDTRLTRGIDVLWPVGVNRYDPHPSVGGQPAHLAPASKAVHAEIRALWRSRIQPAGVHAARQRRVGNADDRRLRPIVHLLPLVAAIFGSEDALALDPPIDRV